VLLGAGDLQRARISAGIVDELAATALKDAADDPGSDLDLRVLQRLRDVAYRDDRPIRAAARRREKDRAVLGSGNTPARLAP